MKELNKKTSNFMKSLLKKKSFYYVLVVAIAVFGSLIIYYSYSYYTKSGNNNLFSGIANVEGSDVTLAMYIQDRDSSGQPISNSYSRVYFAPTSSDYTYDSSKTRCSHGGTVTYENNVFTINSSGSTVCRVYFNAKSVNTIIGPSNGTFNIYAEQNFNEEDYKPVSKLSTETYTYSFNAVKTKEKSDSSCCVDNSCSNITYNSSDNSFDIELSTDATCNIYMDITGYNIRLSEYLVSNASSFDGFDTTDNGNGLLRFIGSNTDPVDNYICLDDNGTGKCSSSNLYRIIGITKNDSLLPDGLIKVIKNTSVGKYKWDGGTDKTTGFVRDETYLAYSNNSYSPTWNESCLNKRDETISTITGKTKCTGSEYSLNDTTNSFLSTLSTKLQDQIEEVQWHCYQGEDEPTVQTELAAEACTTQKVGLIYTSDYKLSYDNGIHFSGSTYNSWLYSNSNRWTISSCDYKTFKSTPVNTPIWSAYRLEYINGYDYVSVSTGSFSNSGSVIVVEVSEYVYPVFYLKATVNYKSGLGESIDDPIRIN